MIGRQVEKQVDKTIKKKKAAAEKSVANLAKKNVVSKSKGFAERVASNPVDLMKDILTGKVK
jgi:predicted transcriptional regulator